MRRFIRRMEQEEGKNPSIKMIFVFFVIVLIMRLIARVSLDYFL
jgi:hypothetical protein